MNSQLPPDFTDLVSNCRSGSPAAHEALFAATYQELRRIAGALMRRERPGHTLQPTELVHDAWFKLVDQTRVAWSDRVHFLNIAGRAMRQVLVDHARRHQAFKPAAAVQCVRSTTKAGTGRPRRSSCSRSTTHSSGSARSTRAARASSKPRCSAA